MKDAHLALRLAADVAAALEARAARESRSKSQVVREAVARYLEGHAPGGPTSPPALTAGQLADAWAALPRLPQDDILRFEADVAAARSDLPPPPDPDQWD